MADNFVANAGSGGDTLRPMTWRRQVPALKIALGVDGTNNGGDVASANPCQPKIGRNEPGSDQGPQARLRLRPAHRLWSPCRPIASFRPAPRRKPDQCQQRRPGGCNGGQRPVGWW